MWLENSKGRNDPRPNYGEPSKPTIIGELDPGLSLAKAVSQARQREGVKKQQAPLRNVFKDSEDSKQDEDAVKIKVWGGGETDVENFEPLTTS